MDNTEIALLITRVLDKCVRYSEVPLKRSIHITAKHFGYSIRRCTGEENEDPFDGDLIAIHKIPWDSLRLLDAEDIINGCLYYVKGHRIFDQYVLVSRKFCGNCMMFQSTGPNVCDLYKATRHGLLTALRLEEQSDYIAVPFNYLEGFTHCHVDYQNVPRLT